MPLDLEDGYTLPGVTKPESGGYQNLPVVAFRYRPAPWPELMAWRRAIGREDEADALAKLVVDHVVSWDVTKNKKPAPIDAATAKSIPEPIYNQIVSAIATWGPKDQGTAEGNSGAASA